MKVKVVFDLPEGMSAVDLMSLLRDSLDDFRTSRCNGNAVQYAVRKFSIEQISELSGDFLAAVGRIQTRFSWTRHFQRDSRNMHIDDPRLDEDS